MAARGQKGVLPRYQAGTVVIFKAEDINNLYEELESWRPTPGEGVTVATTPSGSVISVEAGETDEVTCQLGGFVGGEMIPGWFVGGGISELIEPGAITPAANKYIWIRVTWTADEVDDVLQAGGTAGSVSVHSGSNVPDDSVPTINDLSGIAYIVLGGWDSNVEWQGEGCGTATLSFCPGGFIKGRSIAA